MNKLPGRITAEVRVDGIQGKTATEMAVETRALRHKMKEQAEVEEWKRRTGQTELGAFEHDERR